MNDLSGTQKNKLSGMVGTIIFHGMLLVFLVFAGLSTQVPYPEGGGVEVALGEPDAGGPDEQPASGAEEASNPSASVPEETPEELTSEDEDAPETETKKPVEEKKNLPVKPDKPANTSPTNNTNTKTDNQSKTAAPKLNPALNFKGSGSGSGSKTGNQGQEWGTPGGDPNGTGGSGGGSGGGIGAGVGSGAGSGLGIPGRRLMKKPNLTDDVQQACDVGVEVTVDAAGRVTAARAVLRNSTTTNRDIWNKAERNAMQLQYDASDDGKAVTRLITIKFRPQ